MPASIPSLACVSQQELIIRSTAWVILLACCGTGRGAQAVSRALVWARQVQEQCQKRLFGAHMILFGYTFVFGDLQGVLQF